MGKICITVLFKDDTHFASYNANNHCDDAFFDAKHFPRANDDKTVVAHGDWKKHVVVDKANCRIACGYVRRLACNDDGQLYLSFAGDLACCIIDNVFGYVLEIVDDTSF